MKKISETYTLSYLARHPLTRDIVFKHLRPDIVDEYQLNQVHTTLRILADTNMGGGIPYDTLQKLVTELDRISVSKIEEYKVQ